MNQDSSMDLISTLNGHGFSVRPYPASGFEGISEPGFYFNPIKLSIEHWSTICEYNAPMASHYMNSRELIQDGFQLVTAFDDINGLIACLNNWKNHLVKYIGETEI